MKLTKNSKKKLKKESQNLLEAINSLFLKTSKALDLLLKHDFINFINFLTFKKSHYRN